MVKYYILLSNDTVPNVYTLNERNYLGTVSFETFTPGTGYKILNYVIDKRPELIEKIKIKSSTNKDFTIEGFLTELSKCKRIKPVL